MSRRYWIIAAVVAGLAIGALAAVYLTGLVIVGDPFSGLWNTSGQPVGAKGGSGYLIRLTDDGYVFTAMAGTNVNGWRHLQRNGRTLSGKWGHEEFTFEYQPWNGHLAFTYLEQPSIVIHRVLKKVADSASAP